MRDATSQAETIPSLCRLCHAQCPVDVEVENGRTSRLRGARDNSVYEGFTCSKGRALPDLHASADRLLDSQVRRADGTHEPIPVARALDEIAQKIDRLLTTHGPRSVALYIGTHGYNNLLTTQVAGAFMEAIGSPMTFTSVTIDQPGKAISSALHGTWLGGPPTIEQADVWLATGTNPMHSMLGPVNPGRAFQRAKARGMKLVVIDPRRTEFARRADVHLQPRPGRDPAILAGMLRVILSEGLHDEAFLDRYAQGLDELRAAVEPFTPERVAAWADVPAEPLVAAARAYASGRRGVAVAGTGPNMAGRGNLTEYLSKVLMTVCGHWLQEGDVVTNPGVLIRWPERIAQAVGPADAWGFGERLRVRNLGDTAAGLPTAAAADEMLLEGDGRVRALINLGGNPLLAWPDQAKTHAALESLELLVSIDPTLSSTGRLSHYVVAPTMFFEAPGSSALSELLAAYVGWGYAQPYGQWAPTVVPTPQGSDLIDDWKALHGIAARLGKTLRVRPISVLDPAEQERHLVELTPGATLSSEDLWAELLREAPVPLDEVKSKPNGHVFAREATVQPSSPDATDRLEVGSVPMMEELAQIATEPSTRSTEPFPYRLISRRLPDLHNSSWHAHERRRRGGLSSPTFMNPDDLRALGLFPGQRIQITSAHATIVGVATEDQTLRRGVVAMPHCFGGVPGEDEETRVGGNTSRLSSTEVDYDPYTGIPRMSAIPVGIRAAPTSE